MHTYPSHTPYHSYPEGFGLLLEINQGKVSKHFSVAVFGLVRQMQSLWFRNITNRLSMFIGAKPVSQILPVHQLVSMQISGSTSDNLESKIGL